MLVGEPGIGKTRTAQELSDEAVTRGAQVLWGWSYEEEGAPPYWPWVEPIRSYVQRRSPEQIRSEMGPGAADIAEIVPEIRRKLPDLEAPPALAPEQARFRLFDSITTFLKSASQSQPLLLVLDDLHWADQPSLLLLQFVARQMADSCLMVVGCYRDVELSRQHALSETLAHLSREPVYHRQLLRGLSLEDTGSFIEVTTGSHVSQRLAEVVYSHTEGNPFFMSELTRLLSEREELREPVIGGPEGIRIPEGVREVIGQRLNRLSGDCNRVLSTAAVIGREFNLALINRLIELPSAGSQQAISEDGLLEALEEALVARLIEEVPPIVGHYQFTHRLVQETLIQELSLTRRVRLHARIAQSLEELYEADVESHAPVLAYHYTQAEAITGSEKLVRYSSIAGEQALAAYAYEEAQAHFQRALASKEDQDVDAGTAAILFGLGRSRLATSGWREEREGLDSLERAFRFYAEAGDVDRAVAVAEYPVHQNPGVTTDTAELITRALEIVPPDSHQAGRLLPNYGLSLYAQTGDYDTAWDAFSRALAIAQRDQDPALELRTLASAAEAAWWHLSLPELVEFGRRANDLTSRVDDPQSEVVVRSFVGRALAAIGDNEGAQLDAAAMLTAAERLRDRNRLQRALALNVEIGAFSGYLQDARAFANRDPEGGSPGLLMLSILAMLEYQEGDFAQGAATMDRVRGFTSRAASELTGFV